MNAYLEAGTDVAFVEGPTDREEIERIGERIDAQLLYNFVGELGTSPQVDIEDLESMGYGLMLFPVLSTLAAITGIYDHLSAFKQN